MKLNVMCHVKVYSARLGDFFHQLLQCFPWCFISIWDTFTPKHRSSSQEERKNAGALLSEIEMWPSHSIQRLAGHIWSTACSSCSHNSGKTQTYWRWSKGGSWRWSKVWKTYSIKKDWRSWISSPWRKEGSGAPHHSILALKGQIQRGRRLSLHKEPHGEDEEQRVQDAPSEVSWYKKEIFYSESNQPLEQPLKGYGGVPITGGFQDLIG